MENEYLQKWVELGGPWPSFDRIRSVDIAAQIDREVEALRRRTEYAWAIPSERALAALSGRGRPVRTHPGTPPVRDAEHQAKHRRRKAARAARRRNWRA